MHVDEAVLEPLRVRFGRPAPLAWEGEITEAEYRLSTAEAGRAHDVTLFILDGDRLAFIRKPQYPAGLWRPPGGGVKPGEGFEAGALREALEETGLAVELTRYLVDARARFRHAGRQLDWRTHVFEARALGHVLAPRDVREIEAARWGTLAELSGPLRERFLATGRPLWRYRIALHDAAAEVLGLE
ncbi:MAG TPA: NUDIX hydrolase [Gaiellaceae bacterium]|nr:NUDIX hydrolase [Gaiellaceae bacterium]